MIFRWQCHCYFRCVACITILNCAAITEGRSFYNCVTCALPFLVRSHRPWPITSFYEMVFNSTKHETHRTHIRRPTRWTWGQDVGCILWNPGTNRMIYHCCEVGWIHCPAVATIHEIHNKCHPVCSFELNAWCLLWSRHLLWIFFVIYHRLTMYKMHTDPLWAPYTLLIYRPEVSPKFFIFFHCTAYVTCVNMLSRTVTYRMSIPTIVSNRCYSLQHRTRLPWLLTHCACIHEITLPPQKAHNNCPIMCLWGPSKSHNMRPITHP